MKEKLLSLRQSAEKELQAASTSRELEELRIRYLGKKGELTAILKQMGSLSAEERPVMGAMANDIRRLIEEMLESRSIEIEKSELENRLIAEDLDITLPSKRRHLGHKHPMNILLDEIVDLFRGMGFEIAKDRKSKRPTILRRSIPRSTSFRDMQDTFIFPAMSFSGHRHPLSDPRYGKGSRRSA